jgi:small subunit ribosomal protein S21
VFGVVKPRALAQPVLGSTLDGRAEPDRLRNRDTERTERTRSEMPTDAIQCKPLEVAVGDKGIERAIKHLKRKMAAEGILRELKRRRHYMKPSVKRRKKASEAARRRRKRSKMDVVASAS